MDTRVQKDFPIDWEEDHYVSRREFFKFMTLASGGLAAGSAALAVYSKIPRDEIRFEPAAVAKVGELKPGEAKGFSFPRETDLCILVRKQNGDYVAFSRRCTHLSCPVNYQYEQNRLYCPCHNGAFSIEDGSVLQGPPPHPLPMVKVEVRGEEVWATGITHGDKQA